MLFHTLRETDTFHTHQGTAILQNINQNPVLNDLHTKSDIWVSLELTDEIDGISICEFLRKQNHSIFEGDNNGHQEEGHT